MKQTNQNINEIEKSALIKAKNIFLIEKRYLDFEKDKSKFTKEEIDAILNMKKEKTLKNKLRQIIKEVA